METSLWESWPGEGKSGMQQRTEQDLAVKVRTFCIHRVVVQQDFAQGSCPASECPIDGAASSLPCPAACTQTSSARPCCVRASG